jgi:hypothetical protein
MTWPFETRRYWWEHRPGRFYSTLKVDVAPVGEEPLPPIPGEPGPRTRTVYRRRVEITVSPTGRSVRIYVDGVEIPATPKGDR